jgi:CheY-like chemotaxis protein
MCCMVLIVDDDAQVREVAVETLRDAGITPCEAANGAEALKIVREHPKIEIIILDIAMPGMDGIQVAREVRAIRADVPILYLSGDSRAQAAAKALSAAAWLGKPYRPTQLLWHLSQLGCKDHKWPEGLSEQGYS